ncbi:Crp/Fnr family transcriptional regulator [Capnocytophaga cynodegmi]|uniref:Crp/Fnr family transcriptional regulator n=1 Tax=Capnocytophaga cynodegmi TaxID=28189 RepID=UPI00385D7C8C
MMVSEYFSKLVELSTEEKNLIDNSFELKSFFKGDFPLRSGEVCESEFFVKQGCLKNYYIDFQGNEIILSFAIEHWWIGDFESFNRRTPSKMFVEALEDSEVYTISYNKKQQLLKDIPQLERAYRILLERHLQNYQERIYSVLALSAQERYERFLEKYAKLVQCVPQYSIASFLGVTPETLSRIRAKQAKK